MPGFHSKLFGSDIRPPEGPTAFFANKAVGEERWNRVMFELTNVDSMANDPDVDVTIYRASQGQ